MTLPSQGNPIAIKDINIELGLSPTYSSSLSFLNGFLAAPQASPNLGSFYGLTYYALVTGNCANGNCSASPNNCQYQCTNCGQCNTINCTTTGTSLLQTNCNCVGPTFNCSLITNQYYNCACACDCDCACNCPPPPPTDCAPPPPPADCACACNCSKIICAKLYDEGLLDERIWAADQIYGRYLRKNDKRVYRGYIRWARIVTAWIEGRGPNFLPFIKNEEKRIEIQSKATLKIATLLGQPWADHMAFLMGAAKEDNTMGRLIMDIGKPICRWVDHMPRVSKSHRHTLPVLYSMWVISYSVYFAALVGSKYIDVKNKVKLAWAKLTKQEAK